MLKLNSGQRRASKLLALPQRHTCFVGGSRSGKTTLFVNAVLVRALRAPRSRHGIFRQRANAARTSISLDTLPKVVRLRFGDVEVETHKQEGYFTLPNQSEIWVDGLDDAERVDKILGREYVTMFFNECSQIPYQTILTALTRLAQVVEAPDGAKLSQRAYYDLNPVGRGHWTNTMFGDRRDPVTRQPLADPDDYARAFLNPRENEENLTPEYIRSLENLPERQRKRFYEGVYVDEYEGALWTYEGLERGRVEELPENQRRRVVVAVDPSGAASPEDETRDEIGIVVAALGQDGHGYVLDDRSLRDSPSAWARQALTAYHEYGADCIVAEQNFGGEMVRSVIRAADPQVSVRLVTASRGKAVRAEPVSALYGEAPEFKNIRIHHVGRFSRLEDQMVSFTSGGYRGEGSPDRVDACIAEGSLVETERGQISIEKLGVKDRVLTRKGLRRVLVVRQTSTSAKVMRLITDLGDLVATPDHLIWVEGRGFVRLDTLVCGNTVMFCDTMTAWRKNLPNVLGCVEEKERRPVYDLMIEDEHEFFADGVLVHNCVWAITELMLSSSAEAWISYFSKLSDQARADSEKEKPDRLVPEKLEAPESSVADAYNRVVRRETRNEVVCAWCGEELGSSRTVAGTDQYHEACYLAMMRAGRKQDA